MASSNRLEKEKPEWEKKLGSKQEEFLKLLHPEEQDFFNKFYQNYPGQITSVICGAELDQLEEKLKSNPKTLESVCERLGELTNDIQSLANKHIEFAKKINSLVKTFLSIDNMPSLSSTPNMQISLQASSSNQSHASSSGTGRQVVKSEASGQVSPSLLTSSFQLGAPGLLFNAKSPQSTVLNGLPSAKPKSPGCR